MKPVTALLPGLSIFFASLLLGGCHGDAAPPPPALKPATPQSNEAAAKRFQKDLTPDESQPSK